MPASAELGEDVTGEVVAGVDGNPFNSAGAAPPVATIGKVPFTPVHNRMPGAAEGRVNVLADFVTAVEVIGEQPQPGLKCAAAGDGRLGESDLNFMVGMADEFGQGGRRVGGNQPGHRLRDQPKQALQRRQRMQLVVGEL